MLLAASSIPATSNGFASAGVDNRQDHRNGLTKAASWQVEDGRLQTIGYFLL